MLNQSRISYLALKILLTPLIPQQENNGNTEDIDIQPHSTTERSTIGSSLFRIVKAAFASNCYSVLMTSGNFTLYCATDATCWITRLAFANKSSNILVTNTCVQVQHSRIQRSTFWKFQPVDNGLTSASCLIFFVSTTQSPPNWALCTLYTLDLLKHFFALSGCRRCTPSSFHQFLPCWHEFFPSSEIMKHQSAGEFMSKTLCLLTTMGIPGLWKVWCLKPSALLITDIYF
jgi:hypothetical protein